MEAILDDYFKSEKHKFNSVRKLFAKERGKAALIYQPRALNNVCKKYTFDQIADAIYESVKQRRKNYFRTFLNILGEDCKPGGWDWYLYR